MTNSMTAFASSGEEQPWGSIVCELRTVNHRYLDISIKLPEELRALENPIRSRLTERLKRGKLECVLRYRAQPVAESGMQINEARAEAVLKACQAVNKRLHQPSEINAIEVLKWPGVVEEADIDLTSVSEVALKQFDVALDALCESRMAEGLRLQQMIEERCQQMQHIVTQLKSRREDIMQSVRQRLQSRLEDLKVECDNERFEQEVVYLLQKIDVDEELDRLQSHLTEVADVFSRKEPIGRRLDFLMQEFNREANTLGSKSPDIESTQFAVELKVLIEQMREQVQNIE